MSDTRPHLRPIGNAVLPAECIPSDRKGDAGRMAEDAAANDEVVRGVQLEKKQLTWLERAKTAVAARLPKVDLINGAARRQRVEPRSVGDADIELNHAGISAEAS